MGTRAGLHVPAPQPGRVRTVGRKATCPLVPALPALRLAGKEWGSSEGLGCGGLLIEVHRLNIKPRTPSVSEMSLRTDAGHSTKDIYVPTRLPTGEGRQRLRKVPVTLRGPAHALFCSEPGSQVVSLAPEEGLLTCPSSGASTTFRTDAQSRMIILGRCG